MVTTIAYIATGAEGDVSNFADFGYELCRDGRPPALPTDLTRLEALAGEHMTAEAFGYVAGGAGTENTMRANREAFTRHRLVPRVLRDVSAPDLSVELFAATRAITVPAPVLLGPVGVLATVHPDGELAVARAAAAVGLPMVLSLASTYDIEQVAEASGDATRWCQFYLPANRELGASLLARAKAAGYSAIVVTLDAVTTGWRPRDLGGAYLPFLHGTGVASYVSDPVFQRAAGGGPVSVNDWDWDGAMTLMANDRTFGWQDLAFIREHWDGPIILKGILHPDDARRATDAGMDGIVVSNHGGRQIDGAIASLDALPAVVSAVGDQLTVLFDSGIRTGADVVKAVALGARAVLVARPYTFGLALAGQAGVEHVLRCLLAETQLTMTLAGASRLTDLSGCTSSIDYS
jgi:L-lactate dehydrogenase (cytochrome)